MRVFLFLILIITGAGTIAQSQSTPCTGLPVAVPETPAVCETTDLVKYFEIRISEKLKKGTHSAVYKLVVDCNGSVTQAAYQRGTFSSEDQVSYQRELMSLTWKPASGKSKAVSSIVFVTLEIVNGKFTVVVQ
ncbi:MAG: hypothetical protein HYZ14_10045 [Bacteroidetes bacterium]|nr:hypothetical protein [Bacteroidota bacterium]